MLGECTHHVTGAVLDVQALQRLTEAAEKAKMELSSLSNTSISLPFITATAEGPKHIETNLSRAKFEDMCSDLLDRCRIPVEAALKDAKLQLAEINEVILVGGSTRIPAVQVCWHTQAMVPFWKSSWVLMRNRIVQSPAGLILPVRMFAYV